MTIRFHAAWSWASYRLCFLLLWLAMAAFYAGDVLPVARAQQPATNLSHNYPGGVVELFIDKNSNALPLVRYGIREPVVIEQRNHWQILIGLDLGTLPGEYLVYVKETDTELPAYGIKFNIVQKIALAPTTTEKSAAYPDSIQHRNQSELNFSNTDQPSLPLQLPVAGVWVENFGQISASTEENDQNSVEMKNYVSFVSREPALISAPQNAIVSRIIHSGAAQQSATVFLDHGRGLYSILSGVSDLSIQVGNGISAGAVIGKLARNPNTGLPLPLFWQCMINGAYVNPMILRQLK